MSSKLRVVNQETVNNYDSDSDLSIDEDEFKENQVNVGLIDLDIDDLTSDEVKLFRIEMRSPFFPCKVGGKPAWLDYNNVPLAVGTNLDSNSPTRIKLECSSCKSQLLFLLQIYAPISESDKFYDNIENLDDSFHRVLYVFICSNTACSPGTRTFKVLRSQLNRENDFYSFDPPPSSEMPDDNNNDQLDLAKLHLRNFYKNLYEKNLFQTCAVCSLSSTKKCAKCSFSMYCCQSHQLYDWTKLNHKNLCSRYDLKSLDKDELISNLIDDEISDEKNPNERNDFLFPEREIIIEPESIDFSKLKEKEFKYDEKKITEDLESNQGAGMDQDLDALKESDYDKDFEKFQKITAQEPTQVIRYDRGGTPLWTTKYGKLNENKVPLCEYCGCKRIFEFQIKFYQFKITPQLLNYLNLDESNPVNSVDWAGLYIYTCIRNCGAATNSYANEFIYKQDFVQ